MFLHGIASSTNDNTPYPGGQTNEIAMLNLEKSLKNFFQWFSLN